MLNLKNFVDEILNGNGVENDIQNVWVTVNGEQYTITVESVLGREENEPFESSYTLESDTEHPAWEDLYEQYVDNMVKRF